MGMDVIGKKPSSKQGRYFRNNVWWWRGLADYIIENHPDIAENCQYWYSNDGDGLNKKDSLELAERLRDDLAFGRVKAYKNKHYNHVHNQNDVNTWYQFSEDNISDFAEFLEHCGGFKIC